MKPSNDQILELFNKLDEKKLGYLDIDTISNALKNQFQNQNIHINNRNYYAKELVRICDKTNSGQVTLQEFKDFILEKDLQLQSLFKKISQNGKYIGLEKLETSVKEAGYDVSSKDLQSLLAEIDYNKDGVIDYSEWRDFLLLLPHKPTFINIFKFFSTVSNVDFNSDANALPSSDTFNFTLRLKYLLAGGVAGAVSRTATAPLDRLKVLLQTDTHNHRAYSHWVSIKKGVNIIYNDGGIRSFFKGNGLNCLKIIPESALKFYVFETSKDLLSDYYKVNKDDLGISSRFLAGGMAGLISQFAIYPMETIKTRLMAQIKSHPKARPSLTVDIESNISTTVRNLYRENGIRAFYRGCIPALIGINMSKTNFE
ncbi:mitochondrial carrier domain-containing protein [Globomyces pollinis-pini]|nr:mitochondrial carrier domain-containing protein [Globomyces pollinis-pini]